MMSPLAPKIAVENVATLHGLMLSRAPVDADPADASRLAPLQHYGVLELTPLVVGCHHPVEEELGVSKGSGAIPTAAPRTASVATSSGWFNTAAAVCDPRARDPWEATSRLPLGARGILGNHGQAL